MTSNIWEKYEKCDQYLQEISLVNRTNENWDFYFGNQWNVGYNRTLNTGGNNLPDDNFITSTIKFHLSTICQNHFTPTFNDPSGAERKGQNVGTMNQLFQKEREIGKQRSKSWATVKGGLVQGEGYLYSGTENISDDQVISNTNVLLGDEGNPCIQEQPYVILRERLLVSYVREEARKNGVPVDEIRNIEGDSDKNFLIGDNTSKDVESKCTSIIYFEKKDGIVYYARATKDVEWLPMTPLVTKINGKVVARMELYPIARFAPEDMPNNARGLSSVRKMINNQIEANKTMARRSASVKASAFPRTVYDSNKIQNESDLDKVGANIAVDGQVSNVSEAISILQSASMSPDAANLQDYIVSRTRESNGSVDAITGATDPTRVSGAAVIAMKEQSALPLNESIDKYKQFEEDYAKIWFNKKQLYNPNGIMFGGNFITGEELAQMIVEITIDVSQDSPWTKNAEQAFLDNLLEKQMISIEEYVDLSPDNSVVPKGKMAKMFAKRMAMAQSQPPMEQQQEVMNEPQM